MESRFAISFVIVILRKWILTTRIVVKMQETTGQCEICGAEAYCETRLSPEGYLISRMGGVLIEYNNYKYCTKHYHQVLEMLWSRYRLMF